LPYMHALSGYSTQCLAIEADWRLSSRRPLFWSNRMLVSDDPHEMAGLVEEGTLVREEGHINEFVVHVSLIELHEAHKVRPGGRGAEA